MRFRFCGDADCPDWVLAEMTSLSRLSSVKLKSLAGLVESGLATSFNFEVAEKIFQDSKLDSQTELKQCVACLEFIFRNAVRSSCDAVALESELLQLGLPREHVQAIRRVYTERCDNLKEVLRSQSLRINKVESVNVSTELTLDLIKLNIITSNPVADKSVKLSSEMLQNILNDAKKNLITMQEMINSDYEL